MSPPDATFVQTSGPHLLTNQRHRTGIRQKEHLTSSVCRSTRAANGECWSDVPPHYVPPVALVAEHPSTGGSEHCHRVRLSTSGRPVTCECLEKALWEPES